MEDDFSNDVIDQAYEAAIFPERWARVLDDLASGTDSAFGSLATVGKDGVRSIESPLAEQLISEFKTWGPLTANTRFGRGGQVPYHGFISDYDAFEPDEIEKDPFYVDFLRPRGYGWCAWTMITNPTTDLIVLNVE